MHEPAIAGYLMEPVEPEASGTGRGENRVRRRAPGMHAGPSTRYT